jgi:hypothetical protein
MARNTTRGRDRSVSGYEVAGNLTRVSEGGIDNLYEYDARNLLASARTGSGSKTLKTLALETLCPVEQIDIEARACGQAFMARMKACGKSYVCTSSRESESCHVALVQSGDDAPAKRAK